MDIEPFKNAKPQHGLTLVELLITVAVLGVLISLAAPSFNQLVASNRIAGQTNEFVGGLNLARSEAIRRAKPVAIGSSNGTIDFGSGWKVYTDSDGNHTVDSTDTVVRELNDASSLAATIKRVTRSGSAGSYSYADATTAVTDRMFVVFNARGGYDAGNAAFFKICAPGGSSTKGRIIQVTPSGRISLDSTAENC